MLEERASAPRGDRGTGSCSVHSPPALASGMSGWLCKPEQPNDPEFTQLLPFNKLQLDEALETSPQL